MKKEDILRILNIYLGVVLFVVLVIIIMMILGGRTASNDYQKALDSRNSASTAMTSNSNENAIKNSDEVINEKKEVENKEADTSTVEDTKITKNKIVQEENDQKVAEEKEDDSKTNTTNKEEPVDNKKEGDDKTKDYIGVLEKADEKKNEYEGNYRIKLDGNTDYTYFWFSGDFAKHVNSMVGKIVKIGVEYKEDGTFVVTSGPELTN